MITLALDAMGGDSGPEAVVKGAYIANHHYKIPCKFLLFGDESKIIPILKKYPQILKKSKIIHTDCFIASDMKPSLALRKGRDSSLGLAIFSVKNGESHAVVSSGNTGAYMALSKIIFGMIEGFDRPAIPAIIPNMYGHSIVLDLGANIESSLKHLKQFAIMGRAMSTTLLNKKNPTVALLNIGTEFIKGPPILQDSYTEFNNSFEKNFLGFVENIMKTHADVIVTDGFCGNLVLKSVEGTAEFINKTIKNEFSKNLFSKIAALISLPLFKKLKNKLDPRLYNGAPFLGLKQTAVKSHGSSDALGFANAINVAYQMRNFPSNLNSNII